MEYQLIATGPDDLKEVLANEIEALGGREIKIRFRSVHFKIDEAGYYACHLKLRTASRLLRVVANIPAAGPQMLYDQARRIRWASLFPPERTFLVEGIPAERGRDVMPGNLISKKVREGIETAFGKAGDGIPKVNLKEPKVVVVAHVERGRCTISFDTCGKALHKRGYRSAGHPAPVKETLAASLLDLAGYDGTTPFWDPMCGSGTIAVEAAMKAIGKAPQIHRKKGEFLFEWLSDFNRALWRRIQEQTRGEQLAAPPAPVWASDVSADYVEMARQNALKARVEKHVHFFQKSFEDAEPATDHGLIVTNLPYGERLGSKEELEEAYRGFGDVLKRRFSGWTAALLAAVDSPYKRIGLKPRRRIPIYNGSIECRLLLFDLFEGSGRKTT